MYLSDFYDYKNQLVKDLVTNPKVVKLLNDSDQVIDDPESLIYTQIFPYEYIPETVVHGQTFVCMDVDIQGGYGNKTFYYPSIYVWVFSHKSKLRLSEGGVRTDQLAHEIDKMLNGSRFYGLGELSLYSSKRFAPITDYQGKVLTYDTAEFNRSNPTGKPIPANRKRI